MATPQGKVAQLPLALVSPHMRGPAVRSAQATLRANVWRDFLEGGHIDGEYGPWTARATARAKHELGFLHVTQEYGADLDAVLKGEAKLSRPRRLLRTKRLRAKARSSIGLRSWDAAGADVKAGLTENPPGSNRNHITVDLYKLVGAWCAMAASVWSARGGSKIPILGQGARGRYHYCPQIFADATAGRNGLTLVKAENLRTGDWVLFDWEGNGVADHVGLFGSWIDKRSGRMRTREGNTSYEGSAGSQSDGGAAAERTTRTLANVARNPRGDLGLVRLER
jgi:hypothetical protein